MADEDEYLLWELESPNKVRMAVKEVRTGVPEAWTQDDKYRKSMQSIRKALTETVKYMRFREKGGEADYGRENELVNEWGKAADAVAEVNPSLAEACRLKGNGWADPKAWETARQRGLEIGVDAMDAALTELNNDWHEVVASTKTEEASPIQYPTRKIDYPWWKSFWLFVYDKNNREALKLFGLALAAVVSAGWVVFLWLHEPNGDPPPPPIQETWETYLKPGEDYECAGEANIFGRHQTLTNPISLGQMPTYTAAGTIRVYVRQPVSGPGGVKYVKIAVNDKIIKYGGGEAGFRLDEFLKLKCDPNSL